MVMVESYLTYVYFQVLLIQNLEVGECQSHY